LIDDCLTDEFKECEKYDLESPQFNIHVSYWLTYAIMAPEEYAYAEPSVSFDSPSFPLFGSPARNN
jgi:hypothetical protein